jgi:uncharacterized protein (TIGR03663 family)
MVAAGEYIFTNDTNRMPQRLFIYTAWIGICMLALTLRMHDLGERPIHADEATGARILAKQLQGEGYTFNPKHYHGPLLSLSTAPVARLRGENSWSQLSVVTLRLSPAIAGLLLVLTPLLWRQQLGTWGTCVAAALLATSPLLVYYNRMYIHESWLALFAMLACPAVFRWAAKPTAWKGILAGLSIGLMFATKETFAISILSWLCALALYFLYRRYCRSQQGQPPAVATYFKPAALLVISAALTAIYFYSDGFRHVHGMIDAVRTYFVYETTGGHEKAFGYYLKLLLWPKYSLGIWWSEALIGILALLAALCAFRQRRHLGAALFLSVATITHIAIYSCTGYKTPWLMLVPWAHACLLAGYAFSYLPGLKTSPRIALILLLVGGLAYQSKQSIHATGRQANDARNPYAYVPTSKDAPNIAGWLHELSVLPDAPTLSPIAVVGREYWPLPWYLRTFETVGYWPAPIENMTAFPVVFAMPAQVQACDDLLDATHVKLPRGLRANVPVTLYLHDDIWQHWMRHPEQ